MKSNLLSKSDTQDTLEKISKQWKFDIPKIKNLRIYYITDDAEIITGDKLKILKIKDDFIPFLSETQLLEKFPNVMVDMGAVKFVCNGANIMRPGIRKFTEFEKEQIICVIEESQNKFLSVGKALVSSSEMDSMSKGEVVKNFHYISDKYWETGKTIND